MTSPSWATDAPAASGHSGTLSDEAIPDALPHTPRSWQTPDRKVEFMRDIRESKLFTEQCTQLNVDMRRLDELLESTVWAVARGADVLPLVPETDLRWIATDPWPGAEHQLLVFFRVEDENVVEFQWIEVIQRDADDPTE